MSPDQTALTSLPFLVKNTVSCPASWSKDNPQPILSPRQHFGPNCCPTVFPLYSLRTHTQEGEGQHIITSPLDDQVILKNAGDTENLQETNIRTTNLISGFNLNAAIRNNVAAKHFNQPKKNWELEKSV